MTKLTKASDNIFEDLGFSPEESVVLKIRVDLAIDLEREISAQKLTQVDAAKLLGISRPRLNRLLNGKLDAITIDKLVEMNERIGNTVTVAIVRKKTEKVKPVAKRRTRSKRLQAA